MTAALEDIISQFSAPGALAKVSSFGSGLINDTYLCEFHDAGQILKYILQRINSTVFTSPELVMKNVEIVTAHIIGRLRARGEKNPEAITPTLLPARSGSSFVQDQSGAYWRMFHFIESGSVYDSIGSTKHAYEVGRGLGAFQALVADLAPERLHDTLPGFHHTPVYLSQYDEALKVDQAGRLRSIGPEQEFVAERRKLAPVLTDLMAAIKVPVRVTHNDPKVNNVMLDTSTGKALCMLDLDTVKPGTVLFDFGDCVRSAANPAGEDAEDPASVRFDLDLFEAVADGYLREAGGFLEPGEIAALVPSVKVITFELGIRFLADYLRGDTYFRTRYPGHNLSRARVQFRLLMSIEDAEPRMAAFIRTRFSRS